ncbi:hypothetical protein OB905_13015 [Halobacteria archaeon AArc-dxtr1]|nr:hypothetical protein [Halobacteria archaeon AArc-dxtr1]
MSETMFTPTESAPVSQRVVHAVATETDTDPLELEPLFGVVDPESLDSLFEPTSGGATRSTGTIRFEYEDCEVTVDADGSVDVRPLSVQTDVPRAEATSAQ